MNVFTLLHGSTLVFNGILHFTCKTGCHGFFVAGTGCIDEPAHCQSIAAGRTNFNRDLIVGTAYTAGFHFHIRADMIKGFLEQAELILAALLGNGV